MTFVWLTDGTPLLLRPIRADDTPRLETAWLRSSPESRRQRMHGTTGPLSSRALTDLTRIDHHVHEAIVAIDLADDAIVGIMRYIRLPGRRADAELAALVVDDWQRRGVATALVTELSRRAEAEGILRYVAYVTPDNTAAVAALRHLGGRAVPIDGEPAFIVPVAAAIPIMAEPLILAAVARELAVELKPATLSLDGGARVDVDGVDDARTTFVEIFARQGRLKGAQCHKVARDALKLITMSKAHQLARRRISPATVAGHVDPGGPAADHAAGGLGGRHSCVSRGHPNSSQ